MKIKKTFSISILMVLTISMAFSGINLANNTMEISDEPISAVSPSNAILELNDVLYYNIAEEFEFNVLGEGTEPGPFEIPAYPVKTVIFFSIFSVIGLLALVMHKKRV